METKESIRYILGEKNGERITVETITQDPIAYVSQFEPVDIINGQQYTWNSKGERAIFLTGTDYDNTVQRQGFFSGVDVGAWGKEGPVLQADDANDSSLLVSAVSSYIAASGNYDGNTLKLSLTELMNIAEKIQ